MRRRPRKVLCSAFFLLIVRPKVAHKRSLAEGRHAKDRMQSNKFAAHLIVHKTLID